MSEINTMRDMRDRKVTTWLVRVAVLAFMLATLSVVHANTAIACDSRDVPTQICVHLDCDDLDAVRQEDVTSPFRSSSQHPVPTTYAVITLMQLSPIIFQPPETA